MKIQEKTFLELIKNMKEIKSKKYNNVVDYIENYTAELLFTLVSRYDASINKNLNYFYCTSHFINKFKSFFNMSNIKTMEFINLMFCKYFSFENIKVLHYPLPISFTRQQSRRII